MKWNEVIGHLENIALLKDMLASGNIPHALLFRGQKGLGKMMVAKIFASGILCSARETKPCGGCRSCLSYSRGLHPDIIEVRPEGGTGITIKIDQIRDLKHFAMLSPVLTEGRVCIIEDAQAMTLEAANSLLKLLEEPPPNFYFILVTSPGHPLLATIISRCRQMNFLPLSPRDLAERLSQKGEFAEEKAPVAASLSGGRVGKAIDLLRGEFVLRDRAMEYLEMLSAGKIEMTGEFLESVTSLNRQDALLFLEYLGALFRDMLFLLVNGKKGAQQDSGGQTWLLNADLAERLFDLAPYWNEDRLLAAYKNLRTAIRSILSNANHKLALEAMTIKLL